MIRESRSIHTGRLIVLYEVDGRRNELCFFCETRLFVMGRRALGCTTCGIVTECCPKCAEEMYRQRHVLSADQRTMIRVEEHRACPFKWIIRSR